MNPSPSAKQQILIRAIGEDELLEVTPENLRIRKRILSNSQRMKAINKK